MISIKISEQQILSLAILGLIPFSCTNKEIELYNLEEDLLEKNDLSAIHPEITAKLLEIIREEHQTPINETFIIKEIEEICNTKKLTN